MNAARSAANALGLRSVREGEGSASNHPNGVVAKIRGRVIVVGARYKAGVAPDSTTPALSLWMSRAAHGTRSDRSGDC